MLTPALPWLSGAAPETLRSLALGAAWNGVATCAVHADCNPCARRLQPPVHPGCDTCARRCALTTWAMSYAQKTFAASPAALAYALESCAPHAELWMASRLTAAASSSWLFRLLAVLRTRDEPPSHLVGAYRVAAVRP